MRDQRQEKIAALEAKRKAARDSRVASLEKWLNQQDDGFSFPNCDALIKWVEHGEEGRAYPRDVDLLWEFRTGALSLFRCFHPPTLNPPTPFPLFDGYFFLSVARFRSRKQLDPAGLLSG